MKKYRNFLFKYGKYLMLFLLAIIVTGIVINRKSMAVDIDTVLNSEYYSYLPVEAKDYIKQIYEETGEILLTEKNKKDNELYLNPSYIDYLTLPASAKEEVDVIPNDLIIDYINYGVSESNNLPSYYNISLLDLDNDGVAETNYTTPYKNQGSLNICWAYATMESAESYIMTKNNETYNEETTIILSPRQLDYALSKNGIINYDNPYSFHYLGNAGNFAEASWVSSLGISLVSDSWIYSNYTGYNKLLLSDVMNIENSLYELNSTITMPYMNFKNLDLTDETNKNNYDSYLNQIKNYIVEYGGPYVATMAPGYSCTATNVYDETHKIIDVDNTCSRDGSHAMQIIGWDDNYKYKYCVNGSKHIEWTDECSAENTVESNGAWILRNSWGSYNKDKITYLAYLSSGTEYDFITDLSLTSDRNWNHVYTLQNNDLNITNNDLGNGNYEYLIKINNIIKTNLNAIKFKNSYQNLKYSIYYSSTGNDNDFTLVKDENIVQMPGIVTINFDNITMTDSSVIKIVMNKYSLYTAYYDFVAVFANDNLEDGYLKTDDIDFAQIEDNLVNDVNGVKYYATSIYSDVYNIADGEYLEYKLFDEKGNEIEVTYTDNVITNNKILTNLVMPENNRNEYYTVKIYYKDKIVSTSLINFIHIHPALGSGTESDPYIITTPEDLYAINYDLKASYELGTDIDLTYDTQDSNGKYYNNGQGWIAIGYSELYSKSFSGNFDGKGHSIIGLKASRGLFFQVAPEESNVIIKNIVFDNALVEDYLLSYYVMAYNSQSTVIIENIAVQDSTLYSPIFYGIYSFGKDAININNIFIDGNGSGTYILLADQIETSGALDQNASINMKNIESLANTTYAYLINSIKGKVQIENVFYNNYNNETTSLLYKLEESDCGTIPTLKNIYYYKESTISSITSQYESSNVTNKTFEELKDSSSYSDWDDFDNNWVFSDENNSTHYPMLKFVNFKYTKPLDINVSWRTQFYIFDYIYPFTSVSQNIYYHAANEDNDNYIVHNDGDGYYTAIGIGSDIFNYISYYDGYEGTGKINVYNSDKVIVKFNNNGANGMMNDIITDKDTSVILPKNEFVKVGYIFEGWCTTSNCENVLYEDESNILLSLDTTLYAKWKPITYKIKYVSNYNDSAKEDEIVYDTFTYNVEQKIRRDLFDNDSSKRFVTWNTSYDGTGISYEPNYDVINLTTKEDYVITLYAIWDDNNLTVSFDSNGGSGIVDNINVNYGNKVTIPDSSFIKEGYIFVGWNTSADGMGIYYTVNEEITIKNNLVLYAIWSPISYTVSYDANGGIGIMDDSYLIYDVSANLSKNLFIKEGYTFIGWNTKEDGTGISYKDEASILNLTNKDNDIIVLYANWQIIDPIINTTYPIYNDYINKIEVNTNIENYKNNFNLATGYLLEVETKNDLLYTGGKTKIIYGLNEYKEYINVVTGDINGDGMINSADLLRVRQHLLGTNTSSGAYFLASDIDGDSTINSADLLRVRWHLLGTKSIG